MHHCTSCAWCAWHEMASEVEACRLNDWPAPRVLAPQHTITYRGRPRSV